MFQHPILPPPPKNISTFFVASIYTITLSHNTPPKKYIFTFFVALIYMITSSHNTPPKKCIFTFFVALHCNITLLTFHLTDKQFCAIQTKLLRTHHSQAIHY